MDAQDFLQRQFSEVRRLSGAPLQEITDDHVNWAPPGTANVISATLLHQAGIEDAVVQQRLQGKPRIWERDGWAEKTGVAMVPGSGGGWEELKGQTVALAPIQAYAAAVHAATDAYLASLTDEELRREMPWPFGGTRTVADFLALIVVHTVFHAGEVSALKGVQGVQGIAF
ncbi:MAG: DinB family protein [Thermomicrobiales bacterium]